jgi:hypothetical protein
MRTIDDLMKLWPTVAEFARDIGIKPTHAQTMRVRGSIPVEYWPNILAAAKTRNLPGITADTLIVHLTEAATS